MEGMRPESKKAAPLDGKTLMLRALGHNLWKRQHSTVAATGEVATWTGAAGSVYDGGARQNAVAKRRAKNRQASKSRAINRKKK